MSLAVFLRGPRLKKFKIPDYVCDICGNRFIVEASLLKHRESKHMREGKVGCGLCGRRFESHKELSAHTKNHTDQEFEFKFVCSICGKKFITKGQHRTHCMRNHPKVLREFVCRICRKKFDGNGRNGLKLHIITRHTNYEPYLCFLCEYRNKHSIVRYSISFGLREFLNVIYHDLSSRNHERVLEIKIKHFFSI